MNTPTEHEAAATKTLLDHYRLGEPLTSGRVGWLTSEQKDRLRQLWALLLAEMDTAEPLPVLHSPTQASSSDPGSDISSLSFEPLVALSSDSSASSGGAKKPTPWWLSAWTSKPSPTPPPEKDDPHLTETVQQNHHRTHAAEPLVPAAFVPVFSQPAGSRSFRAAFWQAATQTGDPDSWVLRFLRARSWDAPRAFDMLRRTVVWRVAQAIDELSFLGESLLHHGTMQSGLAFACTADRLQNPVYIIRVRANVARLRNVQAIRRFLCWQIETSQLLAVKSDGKVTMLFDFSGFSRENIDVKLVRTLITLLTNYYPETLGILILHVDSFVFSSLWAVIAPFIDPGVKQKIVMTRNAAELAAYIDPEMIVAEVGGTKQFSYTYVPPTAEENAHMADAEARGRAEAEYVVAVDRYEKLTREWAAADSTHDDAAVEDRAGARETLRQAAIALDPYVRARTLYHRLGFIKPSHLVEF
ncbi:hypothetical protein GGI15_001813 [Coemansia interrupta]|uniref:CRAL-TRIO domain-containing protein n=1 Tax=Coemansia interrupta TaxID=1126814 RepID=A0A9W8HMZ1_9FUNG|nr:hypothetical protein GGI15_001813 [Coemansia interrupta]